MAAPPRVNAMIRRMTPSPLNVRQIRAITLDLDDTLWPVWPTIHHAEAVLLDWLHQHAPAAARLAAQPDEAAAVRRDALAAHPEWAHDVGALRRAALAILLARAGEPVALADAAFDVFYAARQQVMPYPDALPALQWLAARWPIVALTNGNADVYRIGLGAHFRAAISAHQVGVSKPDARIFLAGAAAAGVPPHAVLHVGDDAALDGGALAAGMQMAWVNRARHHWPPDLPAPHLHVPDMQALCERLGQEQE